MTTKKHAVEDIHRALSNPDRIAIMDYLAELGKPASVGQVAAGVNRSQTWTSKCLQILADVGLVDRRQEDQTVWNSVAGRAVWPLVIWKE